MDVEAAAVALGEPAPTLGPVGLGLGAGHGYSGADLTNPRTAVLAGEVPYLAVDGSTPLADPVLELRIHGVGGAPPAENLQSPATVQVAGDSTAGFYRAWYPGGTATRRPRREAYCWGGLNTRATSRAFYLLLVAFMLTNVAHWALPGRPGPTEPLANKAARAVLRLLGLALTVAFFTTAVTLLGDLLAWQASPEKRGGLPSWMHWYTDRGLGPRLALALLLVMVLLGGLMRLSFVTVRSYEQWGMHAVTEEDPEWPLTRANFWHGERSVNRQRNVHVIAVSALVLMFAALPHSSVNGLRLTLLWLAALLGAIAVVVIVSGWTDRLNIADGPEEWGDVVGKWLARVAVGLAVAVSLSRFWWRVKDAPHALPGDQLMIACVVFAEFGMVVLLVLLVLVQAPWKAGREVMGHGFIGPLLAGLAATIGTIFGASLTLAAANLIGTPEVTTTDPELTGQTLLLPSSVFAGGFGMVVALVALIVTGLYFWGWSVWEGRRLGGAGEDPPPDSVPAAYPDPGGREAADHVGSIWARSSVTDRAPAVLTALGLPTAAALVIYLICLQCGTDADFPKSVARIGGTLGVLATVLFFGLLRSALVNSSKRRRFGFLWDVGTFWPRACHPFGPPCYAERSVPEVVTRVRRLAGDEVRGAHDPAAAQEDADRRQRQPADPLEQHSPVLLTGYSQGTPISIAVMAQLPQSVRDRMSLLTLAAPIRRLYGRAFPAYFGPEHLEKVQQYLTTDTGLRWHNLVRRSDYIGGYTFDPILRPVHHARVDSYILDPPTLWRDEDPSPPPAHLHSDWFSDPQVEPHAAELAAMLPT